MNKIHTLGHLQVRMPKPQSPEFVKEWLNKLSVNDTLPRGKAFDQYRHITANSESAKLCNISNPFAGTLTENAKKNMQSLIQSVDGRTWAERVDSIPKNDTKFNNARGLGFSMRFAACDIEAMKNTTNSQESTKIKTIPKTS
ncbi:hypothetical protein [Vibrio anguillarum]|uniref:hypothetical protein n=1 Tax=Vibrio anguillarum TaxID=55601 RepID=UPI000BB5147D|nr:hypothetical protein [Vibrio anguillarum]ATC60210.1 hypothetical protein CMV05_22735 [Vibrio anguillarum]